MAFGNRHALRMGLAAGALALGSALGGIGTPASAAHRAQQIPVAWVNGQPIQRTTLIELLNLRAAGQQPADGKPLAPVTPADRERALEDIIRMELLTQKAQAQGLTDTPQAQADIAYQRDSVLGQRLLKQMTQETMVDDAEVAARHAQIPREQRVTVRHILLADEAAARAAIGRLDAGTSFADVARQVSIDKDSREKAGQLGTANASAFVPPFAEALKTLEVGKYTSQPVRTDFGWHVIQLDARETIEPPPLAEARETLQPQMVREKVEAQLIAWRKAAVVEVLQPIDDKPLADESGVVAKVNGREISRVKLEQMVKARNGLENPYDVAQKARLASMPMAGRDDALEELIMVELLAQRARERTLDQNPSVAAEAELQAKTVAGQLYVRHFIATTKIQPAELKALYESDVPRTDFKVSQIVVADENQAAALIAQLDKGARFATLATAHTIDDSTRASAGSLGWVMNNEMPPELAAEVRKLKAGKHSRKPLKSEQGWHVVRVDAVRPTAARPPLAEATVWLQPKLLHEKVEAHVAQLRAQADVKQVQ